MDNIYLDNGATTKVKTEVLNEMMPYLTTEYGNPSSLYSIGRKAKKAIEKSRRQVAELINCNPHEIYFTGSGSESDNTALKGFAYANRERGNHIITSKIEHHAILETCETLEKQGFEVSYINVDKDGVLKIEELRNAIKPSTILISVMTANNEIGTIQPIKEISTIAKKHNIIFHTDAVQAAGNVKIDVEELGIDALSLSAHKFYGPKGMGALYVKKGIEFERVQDGGHQEKGKRSGTENIAGIVGLAEAIKLANSNLEKNNKQILDNRNYFIKKLTDNFDKIKINGDLEKRLPGNINVTFLSKDSLDILLKLDEFGICASAGSACSTGDSLPSHVLTAIGLNAEEASGTIRFSLGKENTKDEIDYVVNKLSYI